MNTRSRFVHIVEPLPPGVFGGGSIKMPDGTEMPIVLRNWFDAFIDKRRLKRLQRRAAAGKSYKL